MRNLIYFIGLLLLNVVAIDVQSQNIGVVYIQGDVKVSNIKDSKKAMQNLTYGTLTLDKQLTLSKNAMVKLIKSNGEKCELTIPGVYSVKDLKFIKPVEKSAMTRFSEYFMSFFESHPSSESKAQYQNSIYAISRGKINTPIPVFPFEGKTPLVNNALTFRWDIDCDTCIYELVIKDLLSRKEVLRQIIQGKSFAMEAADKILSIGGKYYWFVKVANQNTISTNIIIDLVSQQDFESELKGIESGMAGVDSDLPLESKMVYTISELESKDLTNYAYLYGKDFVQKNQQNKSLNELFEQFFYSKLNSTEK